MLIRLQQARANVSYGRAIDGQLSCSLFSLHILGENLLARLHTAFHQLVFRRGRPIISLQVGSTLDAQPDYTRFQHDFAFANFAALSLALYCERAEMSGVSHFYA
jgi:hypothetical protein